MGSPNSTRNANIDFETRHWPLIVVTLHTLLSDEDLKALFAQWEAVFARREKFVALTDARRVKERSPPKQRAMIAEWTKKIEPKVIALSVGHVTVIESALVRGAMTAVEWLHKPKVDSAYFATLREGCDWAIARLQANDIPVTDALRAYRASLGG